MASINDSQDYLNFIMQKYGDMFGATQPGYDYATAQATVDPNPDFLQNPGNYGLYQFNYNPVNNPTGDPNPYYNVEVRKYVRDIGRQLGLTNEQIDYAALSSAQQHWQTSGQPYGPGDHPIVIADSILKNVYGEAGKPYQGLTPDQITHYNNVAGDFETQLKAGNQDAQDAQDLNEGIQIASIFAGPVAYETGLWAGGEAPPPAYADAAEVGYGAPGFAGGDLITSGSGENVLQGGTGQDLLGQNPYADPNLPNGVNPGNTPLDPSSAEYETGLGQGAQQPWTESYPGEPPPGAPPPGGSPPPLPPAGGPPPALDASMGSSGLGGLGTGVAAGVGAGAVNNALNNSGGDSSGNGDGGTGGSGGSGGGTGGDLNSILTALGLGGSGINLGQLLGAGLGFAGSYEQTQALKDLYDKQLAMGQPYRDQLQQLTSNPDSFLHSAAVTTPVQMGTDALAKSLSVKGNPFGSGTALQSLQDYATNGLYGQLTNKENQLANFGGLSSFNAAAPGTATAAIDSSGGMYNAAGYGVNALLNPQSSLQNMMKQYGLA